MTSDNSPKKFATDLLEDAEYFITRQVFRVTMAEPGQTYIQIARDPITGKKVLSRAIANPGDVVILCQDKGEWAFHEFLPGGMLPKLYTQIYTNSKGEHCVRGLVRAVFISSPMTIIIPYTNQLQNNDGCFLCQTGTNEIRVLNPGEFDARYLSFDCDQYGRPKLRNRKFDLGPIPKHDLPECSPWWDEFDRQAMMVITDKIFQTPDGNQIGVLYRRKASMKIDRVTPDRAGHKMREIVAMEELPGTPVHGYMNTPFWYLPSADGMNLHVVSRDEVNFRCAIDKDNGDHIKGSLLFQAVRMRRPFIFIDASGAQHQRDNGDIVILRYRDGAIHFMPWPQFLSACMIHGRIDGNPQTKAPQAHIPKGPIHVTDDLVHRLGIDSNMRIR